MRFNSEDQRPRWNQGKKGDDEKRDGLSKRIIPNPRSRHPLMLWIIVSFVVFIGFQWYFQSKETRIEISYTRFVEEIEAGNLASVDIADRHVEGTLATTAIIVLNGSPAEFVQFETWLLFEDPDLLGVIREHSPDAVVNGMPPTTNWGGVVFSILPLAVIVVFWVFIMRTMRGGGAGPGKAFSFGKSGARLLTEDRPKVTFDDVASLPEAKQELEEIVEFLREPLKFQRLGGKIPKGALLVGPPGTGKTLLARAVAGEAEVPFLSISGSDFVEMFVGVGN